MKKIVSISSLFLFLLFAPAAKAVNEVCTAGVGSCPNPPNASLCTAPPIIQNVGGCPGGTVWIGSASGGQCATPSYSPSAACTAGTDAFYCETNKCWTKPLPGPPAACTQASVNTGSSLPCCTANQIAVRDATFPTGWKCADTIPGLWMKNGLDAYYSTGNVGINTSTPAYDLDVAGSANATTLCIAGVCISSWTSASPWTVSGANVYRSSGNVGIGASSPNVKLDVEVPVGGGGAATIGSNTNTATGDNAVAIGTFADASGPDSVAMGLRVTASGYRGMAFGTDTVASGFDSTAMGHGSTATNDYTTAMGMGSDATGNTATAMGYSSQATGDRSTAMGGFTTASAESSTAMGGSTTASGWYSTALGRNTTASGWYSTAMGAFTTASNYYSTALGYYSSANEYNTLAAGDHATANGRDSTAIGKYATTNSPDAFVVGTYNLSTGSGPNTYHAGNPLFVVGNGANSSSLSNAMTVLRNGNVGIGTASPSTKLDVEVTSGGAATIGSSANSATGNQAIAMGSSTTASEASSTAMGQSTSASGYASTAMGYMTSASGSYSTAMGGHGAAGADFSVVMGSGAEANSYASLVIGRNNIVSGTPNLWVDTDPLFVIGNGADYWNRSNAVTVLKNGRVGIGTSVPQASLDLGGGTLRISNNGAAAGRVLTSDASGNATWQAAPAASESQVEGYIGNDVTTNYLAKGNGTKLVSSAVYESGGSVGIGTAAPTSALEISKSGDVLLKLTADTDNSGETDNPMLYLSQDNDTVNGYLALEGNADQTVPGSLANSMLLGSNNTYPVLHFVTNNSVKMTVNKDGRVGINTTAPEARLHIVDPTSGAVNAMKVIGSASYFENSHGNAVEAKTTTSSSALYGTATSASGYGATGVQTNNTAWYAAAGRFYHLYPSSSSDVKLGGRDYAIDATGPVYLRTNSVGIGTNPTTYALTLPNSSADGGKGRAYAWATYSDSRVKENLEPLSYGLAEILSLEPKEYDQHSSEFVDGALVIKNDSQHTIGLVAQEVYSVVPEAVGRPADEKTDLWSLDYEKLTPVLINAIKELKAENDALKAVVCEMKPEAKVCD